MTGFLHRFRNRKFWISSAILAVIFLSAIEFSMRNTPCKIETEAFVKTSAEISSRIGNIDSVTMRQFTSVPGSENESAYTVSRYVVRGARGSALVEVRTDPADCSRVIRGIDLL